MYILPDDGAAYTSAASMDAPRRHIISHAFLLLVKARGQG
jgi:hypothetical protein